MLRNERFQALSESLIDGFFADNAILALSKLRQGKKLDDRDEGALLDCADFFAKRQNEERHYHFMMLVNGKKLPDIALDNLIKFFNDFGQERLKATNDIVSHWF